MSLPMPWPRVMVIDDSETDLLLAEIWLQRSGVAAEVVTCPRADLALTALCQCAESGGDLPTLLLLDINMPGMGGFAFLDAKSALPDAALRTLPVVMLSSSPDEEEHQRALSHPAVLDFVVKPASPAVFQALAQRLSQA